MLRPPGGRWRDYGRWRGYGYRGSGAHGSEALRRRGRTEERWEQRMADQLDPAVAAEDPAYYELGRWMLRAGAKFDAVSGHSRRFAAGGRGLFATKTIREGRCTMSFPRQPVMLLSTLLAISRDCSDTRPTLVAQHSDAHMCTHSHTSIADSLKHLWP